MRSGSGGIHSCVGADGGRPSVVTLHEDLFRFAFAEGEIVAANFYFDGVAERREADEFNTCADEKAHFHESGASGGRDFDFSDSGAGAKRARCERLWSGHGSSRLHLSWQRFDKNRFGQAPANPKACVADLTDNV